VRRKLRSRRTRNRGELNSRFQPLVRVDVNNRAVKVKSGIQIPHSHQAGVQAPKETIMFLLTARALGIELAQGTAAAMLWKLDSIQRTSRESDSASPKLGSLKGCCSHFTFFFNINSRGPTRWMGPIESTPQTSLQPCGAPGEVRKTPHAKGVFYTALRPFPVKILFTVKPCHR